MENVLSNERVTLQSLSEIVDIEIKEIVFDYLYAFYKYDPFYLPDNSFTKFVNDLEYKTPEERTISIKAYEKYSLLYEKLKFDVAFMNCPKEDHINLIKEYPENRYITKERKTSALHNRCNIFPISTTTEDASPLIRRLIVLRKVNDNIADLDRVYAELEHEYIESAQNINIPEIELKLLNRFKFYIRCVHMSMLVKVSAFSDEYVHSIYLESKDLPNLTKLHEDAKLSYHTRQYNRYKLQTDYDIIVSIQLKSFENTKSIISFYDILAGLFQNQKYQELTKIMSNNLCVISNIMHHLPYVRNSMCTIIGFVCAKNFDTALTESLTKEYYNDMLVNLSRIQKRKFVEQRAVIESRMLRDANDQNVCLVCYGEIKQDTPVMMCIQCKKYLGHVDCIVEAIKNNLCCPHCRA